MTHCPEKYKQICENFVREYFAARKRQIENNFLIQLPTEVQVQGGVFQHPLETALGGQVVEIARAAAGELGQDELTRGIVAEGIQGLLEDLFTPPGLTFAHTIPPGFWNETPFGRMVRNARLWATRDELITQTAAAGMVGVSVKAVGQKVDRGKLTLYVDDGEPNPQKNRRVSRLEVEVWREQRDG